MNFKTYAKILNRAQRQMLMVCRAYRTISGDALQVIARTLPIYLKARERKDRYNIRRYGIGNKKEITERYLYIWQEWWNTSDKGRNTYEIWDNVKERLELKAEIGHYVVQYLTGHADLAAYLHHF